MKTSDKYSNSTAGDSFFGQMKEAGIADDNFVREIVQMFLEEGKQNLNYLEESIQSGDINSIKIYAHKLKSSFLMFDMHEAHLIATDMERDSGQERSVLLSEHDKLKTMCTSSFELLKGKYLQQS